MIGQYNIFEWLQTTFLHWKNCYQKPPGAIPNACTATHQFDLIWNFILFNFEANKNSSIQFILITNMSVFTRGIRRQKMSEGGTIFFTKVVVSKWFAPWPTWPFFDQLLTNLINAVCANSNSNWTMTQLSWHSLLIEMNSVKAKILDNNSVQVLTFFVW